MLPPSMSHPTPYRRIAIQSSAPNVHLTPDTACRWVDGDPAEDRTDVALRTIQGSAKRTGDLSLPNPLPRIGHRSKESADVTPVTDNS